LKERFETPGWEFQLGQEFPQGCVLTGFAKGQSAYEQKLKIVSFSADWDHTTFYDDPVAGIVIEFAEFDARTVNGNGAGLKNASINLPRVENVPM
jgi:hypothetical protein